MLACRCVVVVGMPYPNARDPELRERMLYLDASASTRAAPAPPAGPPPSAAARAEAGAAAGGCSASGSAGSGAQPPAGRGGALSGRQYYEDLCMKAVNQCVGRVIRHQGDYAAIVLADVRWAGGGAGAGQGCSAAPGPVQKLPGWIRRSWVGGSGEYGAACRQLADFYRRVQPTPTPTG